MIEMTLAQFIHLAVVGFVIGAILAIIWMR
jgi:hypothetical protein